MKNWKSTLAFFIFVGVYIYVTVFRKVECSSVIVSTAGYIALYSSIFMMFRSEFTKEVVSKIIDKMEFKK